MKFPLTLLACALITSCNPDDYFEMNMAIEGKDGYCSVATDAPTCQALPGCQPAYEDTESDLDLPIFSACIANPDVLPPDDGSNPPDDGTNPPDDGSNPPDDGSNPPVDEPTIEDAIDSNCANLDAKYLYVKTITETKSSGGGSKKSSVKKNVKVKVCHQTGNSDAHTIIIACPALNPHKHHHDDYLGACKLE